MEPIAESPGRVRILVSREELLYYGGASGVPFPSRELLLAALRLARTQPGFPAPGRPLQVQLSFGPEGLSLLFCSQQTGARYRASPAILRRLKQGGHCQVPLLYAFDSIEPLISLAYTLRLPPSRGHSDLYWMEDRYLLLLTLLVQRDTQAQELRQLTGVLGEFGQQLEQPVHLARLEEGHLLLEGEALPALCRLFSRYPD